MARLQTEILEIASLIQTKKSRELIEKKIKELHKNFSWTGCIMFDGKHIDIEEFVDNIKAKLKLNCEEELIKIKDTD